MVTPQILLKTLNAHSRLTCLNSTDVCHRLLANCSTGIAPKPPDFTGMPDFLSFSETGLIAADTALTEIDRPVWSGLQRATPTPANEPD